MSMYVGVCVCVRVRLDVYVLLRGRVLLHVICVLVLAELFVSSGHVSFCASLMQVSYSFV